MLDLQLRDGSSLKTWAAEHGEIRYQAGVRQTGINPEMTEYCDVDAEAQGVVLDMIVTTEDLLAMLDTFLADRQGQWWDQLFSKRDKPIPFFVEKPDENLVQMFASGVLRSGKTLELGCGHGRNARFFAKQNCEIDAVDFSRTAIEWADEIALSGDRKINYIQESIYNLRLNAGSYDIVYDSGCFHHQAPHRRGSYLDLVATAMKPGGKFVLVCFAPEGGGGLTDREIYEKPWPGKGIGYSEEQLQKLFSPDFVINECRKMRETSEAEPVFGKDFLWVVSMTRRSEQPSAPTMFSQSFFHGTRADLKPGDLIVAGRQSNFTDVKPLSWVYFAATLDAAIWGAELAAGNGRERVYIVEPTGPIIDDPNLTDKKFPGNPTLSYRSREPLRVIAEVAKWQGHPAERLRQMKDNVARARAEGADIID